jgi:hypothetical protein
MVAGLSEEALVFGVLTAVAHVVLAGWVYRDAESKGLNAGRWVLATLLTGVVGLVGYLLVGRE